MRMPSSPRSPGSGTLDGIAVVLYTEAHSFDLGPEIPVWAWCPPASILATLCGFQYFAHQALLPRPTQGDDALSMPVPHTEMLLSPSPDDYDMVIRAAKTKSQKSEMKLSVQFVPLGDSKGESASCPSRFWW